jgi:hypothetical protein
MRHPRRRAERERQATDHGSGKHWHSLRRNGVQSNKNQFVRRAKLMVKQKNRHRKSELSFSKELNTWVQTVGILIAAVWGVYTFIFKEIWIPESAPVNVTVDLQLNKLGVSNSTDKSGSKQLMAVQMKLSAANSNRLPNALVS